MSKDNFINKGIEMIRQEQYREAITFLNSYSDNVTALYWTASAHLKLSEPDRALVLLDKAISLYDEYADAYTQRGVAYFHLKKINKALDDMNRAVELEPMNPYRYSSRAYIKGHLKQIDSAIEDYRKAIELDPEDAIAHNNLGLLEEQLGYVQLSKKRFEKADKLSVDQRGELVSQAGNQDKGHAEQMYEAASDKPEDHSFMIALKSVFTTKEGFKDYIRFMRLKFLGKSN